MKLVRTLRLNACALLMIYASIPINAQSCTGNFLHDAFGYDNGFELGTQSIGAGGSMTDLSSGSKHSGYQVVSQANKPWDDKEGGGYLPLTTHSGDYMMLIHTSNDRLWYQSINVLPGQTYNICAWIASAKGSPLNGFEVRLRVKGGNNKKCTGS